MITSPPPSGFSDLTEQSQSAFRAIMDAMASPGLILPAPEPVEAPAPLNPSAAMVALTLCDNETSVWLDAGLASANEVRRFLSFCTGAPITEAPQDADIAFISAPQSLPDLDVFALGSDTYPDRSTTLVIMVEDLSRQGEVNLRGPGIEIETSFGASPLAPNFWAKAAANHALFPRGLDFVFCTPDRIAALPRSTTITVKG